MGAAHDGATRASDQPAGHVRRWPRDCVARGMQVGGGIERISRFGLKGEFPEYRFDSKLFTI